MGLELIPTILLALAVGLIVAGVRVRGSKGTAPRHWVPVVGTVESVGPPHRITYRTPDGRRVRLETELDASFAVGREVDLVVDPVDSSRARWVDADRAAASTGVIFLVTGGVVFVLAAITLVAFA